MEVRFRRKLYCGGRSRRRMIEKTLQALPGCGTDTDCDTKKQDEKFAANLVKMWARSLHTDIMPRPRGLIQQLDQHLHRSRILQPNDRLLIACSGGADSVALAHLLCGVSRSNHWHWKLRLVHVNHRTRPGENDLDEAAVRRLAHQLQMPLTISRLRHSAQPRTENDLRLLRWAKFVAVARRYRCNCIITAHHADDQAETFIMRLLRGSGVRGLGAIRPVRHHGELKVVRPLLHIPKAQLLNYLIQNDLPWREDPTNASTHHLRNHVRHRILPELAGCQPQIVCNLVNTAAQMRGVQRLIDHQVKALSGRLGMHDLQKPPLSLQRSVLRQSDALTAMELLRRWLIAWGTSPDRLSYRQMSEIHRLIMRRSSNLTVSLSDAARIVIEREEVRLMHAIRRKPCEVRR